MQTHVRTKVLGNYGERVAKKLLISTGFSSVRDLNEDRMNHPYGDFYAERNGTAYIISVRTRNKYQSNGQLNPAYNFRKKSADVEAIAAGLKSIPAWIAIQVDVKLQHYCAYFGTMAELNVLGDRYSIPMTEKAVGEYLCLARDVFDGAICAEWDNKT